YLDPERPHGVDDRHGAAHRARGPVERREEAIARGVDLNAPVAREQRAHDRMVPQDQLAPAAVTEVGGMPRRVDDIGEENGGEDAVERRLLLADLREEAAHLGDDGLAASVPVEVWPATARVLDDPRRRDLAGHQVAGLGEHLVKAIAV